MCTRSRSLRALDYIMCKACVVFLFGNGGHPTMIAHTVCLCAKMMIIKHDDGARTKPGNDHTARLFNAVVFLVVACVCVCAQFKHRTHVKRHVCVWTRCRCI